VAVGVGVDIKAQVTCCCCTTVGVMGGTMGVDAATNQPVKLGTNTCAHQGTNYN